MFIRPSRSCSAVLLSFCLSSAAVAQVVFSSTTLTPSSNPAVFGAPLVLTARVTPNTAAGTVIFYSDASILGRATLSSGAATITTSLLSAGRHVLTAHYMGDGVIGGSLSDNVIQTVQPNAGNLLAAGTPIATGSLPVAIATGDFNRDGKTDFAVVNENSNTVSVLLGGGNGTFQPSANYTVGGKPDGLAAADVNGDGTADLIVSSYANNNVSVLLGRADGTFQAGSAFDVGFSALAVAAGDFNADGNVDLAVATYSDLKVLLGNGDGTFQAAVSYIAGSNPYALAVGDLNGDGFPDVAVTNGNGGSVSVFLAKGTISGALQPAVTYAVGSNPRSIAIADVNKDQKPDLVVANFGGNNVSVLPGNGDGTFQTASTFADGSSPTSLSAADFNGDGNQDLILASYAGNGVGILLGKGDGTFQATTPVPGANAPYALAVADFNGDGIADIVAANGGSDSAVVFLGYGATLALSGDNQSTIAGTSFSASLRVTVTDSNAQPVAGVPVAFAAPSSGATATLSGGTAITDAAGQAAVSAIANRTVGAYSVVASAGLLGAAFHLQNVIGPAATVTPANTPQRTGVGSAFSLPLRVAVMDSAGNPVSGAIVTFTAPSSGASAVLSASTSQTDTQGVAFVTAMANGTAGSYTVSASTGGVSASFALTNLSAAIIGISASPTTVRLGAATTLTAVVTPGAATGTVEFFDGGTLLGSRTLASGSASLTTALLPAGIRKVRAVYTGDSTYGGAVSNAVAITVTSISSNFLVSNSAALVSIQSGSFAYGVAADFNGDGNLDFAATVSYANKLAVVLGNGDGTFQPAVLSSAASAPGAVAAGDFNGDGKVDIVYLSGVSSSQASLNVLPGKGDGTFGAPIMSVIPAASQLSVADFNADGKVDLLVSYGTSGGAFYVLLGNGDGTFQTAIPAGTSAGSPIAIGDFNGDGRPDLALILNGANAVGVMLGKGDGTFQSMTQYPSTSWLTYVAIGDVNGDGIADIVGNGQWNATTYLGKGDGSFQPAVYTTLSFYTSFPALLADFNGDGKADIAAPSGYGIVLDYSNGDGSFVAAPPFSVPSGNQVIAGDWNRDGRTDVVTLTNSTALLIRGEQVSFTASAGTPQTTVAGTAFGGALEVTATDSLGNRIPGLTISFSSPNSGASATLSSTSAVTNGSGVASVAVVANSTLGSYNVTATTGGLTATFSLTNSLGAAASLAATSGTPQCARVGTSFARPLQVTVKDAGGNVLNGVTVAFSAPAAGASAALSAATAVTNANGVASITATANATVGSYLVTATVGALTATFSLGNQGPSTVTLTTSPNPSTYGSRVTLTASVIPAAASGSVLFYDGTALLGGGVLSSGSASLSTTLLASGARKIKAVYGGDPTNAPASSNVVTQTVTPATANLLRAQATTIASGNWTLIGDFDGNGKPDILAASYSNANLARQMADGSFQTSTLTIPYSVMSALAGDFNGDGKLDLAFGLSYPSNSVKLYLGNGDGTFTAGATYATPSPSYLAVSDFNQDGVPDIAVAGGTSFAILTGWGDGTFLTGPATTLAQTAYSEAAADFNGDGKTDLVFALSNNTLAVLLGNGDATFQAPLTANTGGYYYPNALVVADFNGDGKPDIATANSYAYSVSVLLGNGDGSFQAATSYQMNGLASGIVSADMNGDGKVDLVATVNSGLVVLYGNGNGGFPTSAVYSQWRGNGAAIADLNGDGKADVVISDYNLMVLLGAQASMAVSGTPQTTVAGTAFASPLKLTFTESGSPISGVMATFTLPASGANASLSSTSAVSDSNGVVSVTATANNSLGNYTVTANAGPLTGSFLLANTLGAPATMTPANTPQATAVSTAFVKPLRVTVKDAGGNVLNGVTVTFTAPLTGATALLSSGTVVTDNTGLASVLALANGVTGTYAVSATAGAASTTFSLTNQRTSGVTLTAPSTSRYGAPVTLSASVTPSGAVGSVTFFDGPVALGSAAVNANVATLATNALGTGARTVSAVFTGDSGTAPSTSNRVRVTVTSLPVALYSPPAQPALPYGAYDFAAGDLNGDGKLDIVTIGGGGVFVLIGNGDGSFQSPVLYSGGYPYHVALGDFNGDGRLDVMTSDGGSLRLFAGKGDGTLQSGVVTSSAILNGPLVAADFNSDGKLDVAVMQSNGFDILLGNGDGSLQPPAITTVSYTPNSFVAADFDGDARLDLAYSTNSGVFVLLANSDGTFQSPTQYGTGPVNGIVAADFNGDGKLDIAYGGYYNSTVVVLLGTGSGTFQAGQSYVAPASGGALAPADLDGDGFLDIAVGAGNALIVLRGLGTGAFQPGVTAVLSSSGTPYGFASAVIPGDLNGDGRVDIVGASYYSSGVSVLLGIPGALTATSGSGQSAPVNSSFASPLVATVTDASGSPLAGISVAFTPSASAASATVNSPSVVTTSSGTASTTVRANSTSGTYAVTATAGFLSAAFNLTNLGTTPTALSVQPSSGGGFSQTFTFAFSDPDGVSDLTSAQVIIGPSNTPVNSCYVWVTPSTGDTWLAADANTAWIGPIRLGTGGTLQNSQCIVNVLGSSASTSGTSYTLNLNLTFKASPFGNNRNIYGYAAGGSGTSGWQTLGSWSVPPTVLTAAVTPASGSGLSQTFTFVYTDSAGAADLSHVLVMFGTTNSVTSNGCVFSVTPSTRGIVLNDDTNAGASAATLGVAGTAQNSQCAIDAGASSGVASGNTYTLTVAMRFKTPFAGSKNIYAQALSPTASTGNFLPVGTWTVPAAATPQVLSATPTGGTGYTQNFTFTYSDPLGAGDLASAQMIFGTSTAFKNSCYVWVKPSTGEVWLDNDGDNGWLPSIVLGRSGTLQNTQCSVNVGSSSATVSGLTYSVTLAVTFKAAYGGGKNIYGYATSANGANSGWQTLGAWIASAAPSVVSLAPVSGSGASQIFTLVFSDPSGAADLGSVQVIFGASASTFANTCAVLVRPATGDITLQEGGSSKLGSAGTIQNNQCAINVAVSSGSSSGTAYGLALAVVFKPAYASALNIYAIATTLENAHTEWLQMGTWTATAATPAAPQIISAAPSSGNGTSGTFAFTYSNGAGLADLSSVQAIFGTSTSAAGSCYVSVQPVTGRVWLNNDADSSWGSAINLGTSGTLQNSQCSVDVGASTATGSETSYTVSLAITFKGAYAGAKNIYGYAVSTVGGASAWQALGAWTVPAPIVTSLGPVSVSPASGSGASQNFTFTFTDPSGASDLASAQMIFGTSTAFRNTCYVWVKPSTGEVWLDNDGDTAWGSSIVAGRSGSLQNSQCAVNVGASSATASGNTYTVTLAMTFKSAYSGVKNAYGYVSTNGGRNSGWQTLGTWTAPGPVVAPLGPVSVNPPSGTGLSQNFTFVFSDPSGASDLASAQVIFGTSTSFRNTCYVWVQPSTGQVWLDSDLDNGWPTAVVAGNTGTVQNSQCAVNVGTSSAVASGSNYTVTLAVTFKNAYAGAKNVYGYVSTAAGANSGWQPLGTWTVAAPVVSAAQPVSVTPASGSGASQNFAFVFSDAAGASDIASEQIIFGTATGQQNTCYLSFTRATGQVWLDSDGDTGWGSPLILGNSGTLQNSQCSVDVGASSGSASGNNYSLTLAVTFKSAYGGVKNVYATATTVGGASSGWQTLGAWTAPSPVVTPLGPVSVTPASGSGASQNFTFTFADPAGVSDLASAQIIFGTSTGFHNTCYVWVKPSTGEVWLDNDGDTGWLGAIVAGRSGSLQNGQCGVNVGASSVSASGTTYTVTLAMMFNNSYAGAKSVYGYVSTNGGQNSGWHPLGTWTVPAPVVTPLGALSVSPSSGSGTVQNFTLTFSDPAGASDLASAQVIFGTSTSYRNTCYVWVKPSTGEVWLDNDSDTNWASAVVLGRSGTLSNSQCSVNVGASGATASGSNYTVTLAMSFAGYTTGSKNIYGLATTNGGASSTWQSLGAWSVPGASAATPVSVSPASGSGSSRPFTFTFSDTAGAADIASTVIVFGTSTGVQSTCYLSLTRATGQLVLLNDSTGSGAPLSIGAAGTLQNSQCSVNVGASSASSAGNTYTVTLAMTFTSAYSGLKNIYGYAVSNGGVSSGWLTLGTWTVAAPVTTPLGPMSVAPASGSGASQNFTFVFSDPAGASDLASAQMIFGASTSFRNTCYVWVKPSTGQVWVDNDLDNGWSNDIVLGRSGTLQNSQCAVDVGASSAVSSGATYSVTLAMSFKTAFAGGKTTYGLLTTNGGQSSGWSTLGTWTVAGGTIVPLGAVSVNPASGAGASQPFTFVLSDPAGASDLASAQVIFGTSTSFRTTCYVWVKPSTGQVWVDNDLDNGWSVDLVLGRAGTLQNSQCSVDVGASSAVSSGNTYTVTLAMSFKAVYAGAKNIYGYATTARGTTSTWTQLGAWTAQ